MKFALVATLEANPSVKFALVPTLEANPSAKFALLPAQSLLMAVGAKPLVAELWLCQFVCRAVALSAHSS